MSHSSSRIDYERLWLAAWQYNFDIWRLSFPSKFHASRLVLCFKQALEMYARTIIARCLIMNYLLFFSQDRIQASPAHAYADEWTFILIQAHSLKRFRPKLQIRTPWRYLSIFFHILMVSSSFRRADDYLGVE